MKGIYFVMPVWGERYVARWLRYGLPSILAPGNLPALAKSYTVKLLLLSTAEDLQTLLASPLIKAVRNIAGVRAVPIAANTASLPNPGDAVSACYNHGLAAAAQDDYGIIPGAADIVYADGALGELGRHLAAGMRAAITVRPRVNDDQFEDLLHGAAASIRRSGTALAIPPRSLVRLAMQGLHAITRSQCWDADRFTRQPSTLCWPLGDHGMLMRTWQPYPAFLYPDRPAKVTTTIDGKFLDEAISDARGYIIFDDSDRYCSIVLTDRDRTEGIPNHVAKADAIEVGAWLPRQTTAFNEDLIQHRFWFHDGVDPNGRQATQSASDRVIAAVLDRYAKSQEALGFLKQIVSKGGRNLIDTNSSPWWQTCQANILTCVQDAASPRELIYRIQANSTSGFDHRVERQTCNEVDALCHYKWKLLNRMFPELHRRLGDFGESLHALPTSIVEVDGRRLSNIFLSHLEFFLFIATYCRPNAILEIGGGYGSLARIICSLSRPATYVIVDMPTSLLCAYIYLREALPDTDIELAGNLDRGATRDPRRPKIYLVPSLQATKAALSQFNFDLAINTGSFQEMPADTCRRFQNLIFEELRVPLVYSNNYFLNPNDIGAHRERNQAEMPLVPNFPSDYHVAAAVMNNPVFDIDASDRNWLEVLISRDAALRPGTPTADERNLCRIIEAICRKGELSLMTYLRAYAFIARFYFGGTVRAPFGWGDCIQSNLFGANSAFPNDLTDPDKVRSWFNTQIAEIALMRRRMTLHSNAEAQRADKIERWLISKGLERYRTVAAGRTQRQGLPTITSARLAEYQRVLSDTDAPGQLTATRAQPYESR